MADKILDHGPKQTSHLADISDEALETKNEHRLVDGSVEEISTDDKSDGEPESETESDSD